AADDGNPCTADTCDAAVNVVHTPVPGGTSCADSTLCNGSELCDGNGTCVAGTPISVDDANPCTTDSCDPIAGTVHVAVANGTPCPDADRCNGAETCSAGACTPGAAPAVDDGNPCTADSCDAVNGVRHDPAPSGTACDDHDACTSDACVGSGACVGTAL